MVDPAGLALLIISLLAVVAGPLLYQVADRARPTLIALDGFVLVAVTGMVIVHIIPHAVVAAGPLVLLPALFGFMAPGMVEHSLTRAARQAHSIALMLAFGGLMVHAFFDGVALSAPGERGVSVLAVAVAIHRLPIAITTWALLRPAYGRTIAMAILAGDAIATTLGYAVESTAGLGSEPTWVHYFEALVGGSLLHVLIHRPTASRPSGAREQAYAGVAGLLAVGLVAALSSGHFDVHGGSEDGMGVAEAFLALARATAPALLLAFALAGLLQVFLPHVSARWLRTGRPFTEATRGMAFGLPLPICSCGVIPVYRTLIGQGVPATAAMAFLVATPELGIDSIILSWPLLGGELAIARLVGATIVALAAGVLVGRIAERRARLTAPAAPPFAVTGGLRARLRAGLQFGFGEVVDHTGPWILVGLAIAAVAAPLLDGAWFARLPWGVDVLLFALIGMPTYVCASGATPLVAVLIFKGVSPGAAFAFLLSGPATNVTTFGVLQQLHGRRVAILFGAVIGSIAVGLGLLVNLFLEVDALALAESAGEEHGVWSLAALIALAVVFAASMIRQGPRGFIDQIIDPYEQGEHGHEHDEAHVHDVQVHAGDHAPHVHDHDRDHDHGPVRGRETS